MKNPRELKALLLAGLLFFGPACFAAEQRISETAVLAPVFAEAKRSLAEGKKPLVVFDIDNVLLCDDLYLGNRAWFRSLYAGYLNALRNSNPALYKTEEAKLSVLLLKLEESSAKKLVEPDVPARLRELRAAGIKAMALTGRHAFAMAHTVSDLKARGVDLSSSTPFPDIKSLTIPGEKEAVGCSGGVCFGALQDKGRFLLALLARGKYKPDVVIFVDDSVWNVNTVGAALKGAGISYAGFRYSGRDRLLQSYETPEIQAAARVQLKEFAGKGRLLDNEKAQALSKTAPVTFEEELQLVFGTATVSGVAQ